MDGQDKLGKNGEICDVNRVIVMSFFVPIALMNDR